jgi:hypothetical protein
LHSSKMTARVGCEFHPIFQIIYIEREINTSSFESFIWFHKLNLFLILLFLFPLLWMRVLWIRNIIYVYKETLCSFLPNRSPGVPFSTRSAEIPRGAIPKQVNQSMCCVWMCLIWYVFNMVNVWK